MLYDCSTVRRQDRLLEECRAIELLQTAAYGFLALATSEGGYGVPLNFVLRGSTIYFHSAMQGRKLRAIEADCRATFCVVGDVRVVAEEFTSEYESVVVKGRVRVVEGDDERVEALRSLVAKYSPTYAAEGDAAIARSKHRTAVLALECESFSGKTKRMR